MAATGNKTKGRIFYIDASIISPRKLRREREKEMYAKLVIAVSFAEFKKGRDRKRSTVVYGRLSAFVLSVR